MGKEHDFKRYLDSYMLTYDFSEAIEKRSDDPNLREDTKQIYQVWCKREGIDFSEERMEADFRDVLDRKTEGNLVFPW